MPTSESWRLAADSRQATKSGRLVTLEVVAEPPRAVIFSVSRRADFYWATLVALAVVTGAAVVYTRM